MWRAMSLVCAASIAAAPGATLARSIMGAGALACTQWVERRRTDSYYPAAQWVLGYLSRADRDQPGDILAPVESAAVVTWMDQYCAAHPQDDLETAAFRLEVDTAGRAPSEPAPPAR